MDYFLLSAKSETSLIGLTKKQIDCGEVGDFAEPVSVKLSYSIKAKRNL
jgi:hypothetical protein